MGRARDVLVEAGVLALLAFGSAGANATPALADAPRPFAALSMTDGLAPGPATPAPLAVHSALALAAPSLDQIGLGRRGPKPMTSTVPGSSHLPMLSAARARILLRSLTVPGWGQATLGRRGSAAIFGLAEAGVWGTFTAFRIQEQMRRESYERTARIFAGIDMHGRDEEFRRIVGSYLSSDEYNQFVVFRDAANLYYDDPVNYRAYIAKHELRGRDAFSWPSIEDILRYRAQRKDAQRAGQRANTALAVAVVNRFLSAIHAARLAGRSDLPARSWNLEVSPAPGGDATAFRFGLRARF